MINNTTGFIGAGNMATALIGGLIKAGIAADTIVAADPDADKLAQLQEQFNIRTGKNNQYLLEQCGVIVLAVKPQIMRSVIDELSTDSNNTASPLYISIAAGITTDAINNWFGQPQAIVRTMPNTPALVQAGVTGLYATANVSDEQKAAANEILSAVGKTIWVEDEALLDTITALSGSGPAYFFLFMQAMAEAGTKLGLSADDAQKICIQTALGAAKLANASDESPEELRKRVTSPGGTTEAAISVLQSNKSESIISDAVKAAHDRAKQLAKQLET